MKAGKFFRAFVSSPAIIIYVTIALSLSIWFFGPLLAIGDARPFDSRLARGFSVAAFCLSALVFIALILWRNARKDKRMEEEIVAQEATGDDVVTAELGDLRTKLRQAITQLRKANRGGGHLYELPWYIMIGPPGAGKTTAIVNSGLQFPLSEEIGKSAIGGVGGTRNCDWWFTNEAVLLDTAGRYTTQESDREADKSAWLGFLTMLKKYRPRQPINGAIVSISLSDLALQDASTQRSHALAVRTRLQELRERLGVRFPIYVLFTKADLVAGFAEFFEPLGREDRQQVWGFTLPIEGNDGEPAILARFDEEFSALLGQLNAQSLKRIKEESDPERRALVAGFPMQMASIRAIAKDFLTEVFQGSRFEDMHFVRGVYLTSGTQEGTPIDRLMMGMARTFGIGRQAIGSGQGTGRSYFLTNLFDKVMFPEAGLVSADDKVERRYRWARAGAIAAALAVSIGCGAFWANSFIGNRQLLATATADIDRYRALSSAIPGNPIGDSDLLNALPALNTLRDLPANPAVTDAVVPARLGFGLYQGEHVGNQVAQTYRSALNQHFLPRLLLRLEEQMQGNINNSEFLYEALKVYLMLGLQGPMSSDLIKDWMEIDWSLTYPGEANVQVRADFAFHLDELLSQPMLAIELNGPLVEQVQVLLSELPLAERIYSGIVNSPAATALPEWRLTDIGGPAVSRVLVRPSGKPLSEGIEGIFTRKGFHEVFLNEALSVAERVQRESWVLGPRGEAEQSEAALLTMSRDVLDLYYTDYAERYESILGDVDIIPLGSLRQAVDVTNVLSGPTSPVVNILTAISEETRLAEPPQSAEIEVPDGATAVAGQLVRQRARGTNAVLLRALSQAAGSGADGQPAPPGSYVEERFAWLSSLVARVDGQPSELDGIIAILGDVYRELNKIELAGGGGAGDNSALFRFREATARLDGPLQRWSNQISSGSSDITADGARAQINARWQAQVLPFCTQALSDRYPINRRAKADVAMQDFARLFAPQGMIDQFFAENLSEFVDTRTRPWSWKQANGGADLGISQKVLEEMQKAAEIRDTFFASGAAPAISFQITPEALDTNALAVVLEIDGQQVGFNHRSGQPTPQAISWPGAVGIAKVAIAPSEPGRENNIVRDGPWGWFRLLDSAEVRKTNASDRSRVIFNIGGRIAIFRLQTGSVLNPFTLPALSTFNCPKSL
ncbi:type VI secretion system membrane subunit TssM [Algicella marina]|uniref:Type VI secretion system membrane subunit TssM n=1 Tax=Algicella marina TaxID=2683284 RepID=A0A6P1T448_9RHOB|nr:type VI secretion system membrane subunit TssM [Algicella marina]QHQ36541.1 type VI secretion system membrane subunit TssM [Algicella marina]